MNLLAKPIAKLFTSLSMDALLNAILERHVYRTRFHTRRNSLGLVPRYQVLVYHKVSPESHSYFEPVSPGLFERHMRLLVRRYQVLRLSELVERSRLGEIPERAVAITFDDGYADNYEYAFPILQKYKLPATIFVSTGAVDSRIVLWHDRIFDAFRFASTLRADLKRWDLEVILDTRAAARSSLESAIRKAKLLSYRRRMAFVDDLEATLKPDICGRRTPMLTWTQIHEMHTAGIDFGSHTVSHPILSRMEAADLHRELSESKAELESHLGVAVPSLAYPNGLPGDYNEEVKAELKKCGYHFAVTTCPGVNTAATHPFELRRGQPWHQDLDLFRLRFFLQRHWQSSPTIIPELSECVII